MTEPTLALRISRWRAHRNLTLKEIGDACGMTRQAAFNVESGTADLTVRKLAQICRVLKTDLATFFGPLPPSSAKSGRPRSSRKAAA